MNKIKRRIFKMLKNQLLRCITKKLGKVEITNDKIICYVDNKKLKKYKRGKYLKTYELIFKSKQPYSEETLNIYKVNKPVYYVINNMDFEESVMVMASEDSNIAFINCKFNRELTIYSGGEIVLENNRYCDDDGFYRKSIWFCAISAKTLRFVNDHFINISAYKKKTNFGMRIGTDKLEIINSTFDIKKNDGTISIFSKNVDIKNSDINCYNSIYLKSDEINTEGCLIKSKAEITIENKNNNDVLGFTSPKTIYNGIDLSGYYCITPHTLELQKARISLVEKLRKVRDYCVNTNSNELKEIENKLNQKTIGQMTRKNNI